ncbi:MAG: glycine/sarcosine/betaine reductase selenoprotein B family protein [Alphaproteobacteria bacterium]|jgi:hypothetical protein|nr:glycine/sarcosine/betaine reductase selenoprotein B family protein [Alphaproteobacteria bacterium]MDP6815240.1 glycine/sarcosine/betaine reductase selenoprotein B family protein [Alphaproteobacteria bacterium]
MTDQAQAEPVRYMERTRRYYRALGYDNDYVWARFDEVPFARLGKPLREATIALITTAGPPGGTNRNSRGRKEVWSGAVASPPESYDTDLAWDKEATHVDDRETFLPIDAARRCAADGLIAGLTPRFHGAATDYSQRKTLEHDAPELLRRLREDGADGALITAL